MESTDCCSYGTFQIFLGMRLRGVLGTFHPSRSQRSEVSVRGQWPHSPQGLPASTQGHWPFSLSSISQAGPRPRGLLTRWTRPPVRSLQRATGGWSWLWL